MSADRDLAHRYAELDRAYKAEVLGPEAIDPSGLLVFPYEQAEAPAEVEIETDEFTAVCPWTGLPDWGVIRIRYLPGRTLLELKSFKYYLLGYRNVGIVQEHVAGRILADLCGALAPRWMELTLDYKPRGGLHTVVRVSHPNPAGAMEEFTPRAPSGGRGGGMP
ncbi:MAG: NADPH-dependent 7-cyano-7-deazaguanine reductase QueF [Myxococcales bacterium]|nr:NADPH-dependent 7-cyano-7-deazaguanine reductase QueF [Myxococcales bacterium]